MSKYNIQNDPNKDLEAQKYENPIPSREVILSFIKDTGLPVSIEKIADALEIHKKAALEGLSFRLGAMVRDGQIAKDKYYFSALDAKPIFITSKVSADRDGRMEVFSHSLNTKVSVLPAQAKMLFVGDEVNAKVLGINKRSRLEAEVKSIVSRSQKTITGYYDKIFDGYFLKPISKNSNVVVTLLPPPIKLKPEALIEAEIIIQPSVSAPAVARFTKEVEQVSPVKEAMMC